MVRHPPLSLMPALVCGDTPASRSREHYWRTVQKARATQPTFGPLHGNALPALIVQATKDTDRNW